MATTQQPQADFVKALSRLDATALVVGSMIGSGIFIVSAEILREVHAPGLLLVVWAVSGIVTLRGALTYGELEAMFPRAGGQYVYLREGISPLFGYLYGWTLFVVIQTGTIAAVAVAFARFTSVLVPSLSPDVFLGTTIKFPDPIGPIADGRPDGDHAVRARQRRLPARAAGRRHRPRAPGPRRHRRARSDVRYAGPLHHGRRDHDLDLWLQQW